MAEYGQHPDFWGELYVKHPSGVDTYAFGVGPYADPSTYYLGWKAPVLRQVSSIERAASSSRNQIEAVTVTLSFYDFDNFFRGLFRDAVKGGVLGYEVVLRMISRRARKQLLTPDTVLRVVINDRALPPGKQSMLVTQDIIGAQFGPFGYDKKLTGLKLSPDDFDDIPPDYADKQAVPLVYGPWSDIGTTLADGTPYEKGRLPLFYVGNYTIQGGTLTHVPAGSNLLPPPPAPTYTVVGSPFVGTHTWTFAAVVKTTNYTTLGATLTLNNLPSNGDKFPVGSYLIFHLAQYSPELQAQVTGARLYVKEGDPSSSSRWHYVDGFGEAFNTAPGVPFAGGYGFQVGAEQGTNPGDSFFKPWNPVPTTNQAFIDSANGPTYRTFVLSRAFADIDDLFASPINADQTLGEGRVIVPLSSPDFIRYGHASWPFAGPTVPVNGNEYTMVFGIGARADHAVSRDLSIAVNACGYTQTNTTATHMISDPFLQCARLLNDFVYYNGGEGWKNGPWPVLETFPGSNTVQVVNAESFQRVSDYYNAKLGRRPLGHIYIKDEITLREFLRQFMQDFDVFFYINTHGQICCGILNELTNFTNAQRLRDRIEIRSVGAPSYDEVSLQNLIRWVWDYDYDISEYRNKPKKIEDTGSHDYYRRWAELPLKEVKFSFDEATVDVAMNHELLCSKYTPTYYPILVGYAPGLNVEIEQPVLVTNDEHNFVDRKMIIMRHKINPPTSGAEEGTVLLTCLDVEELVA